MSDIDSYDRLSSEILLWLSVDSLKNTTELAYLKRYRALHSAYCDKEIQIRMYNSIVSERENRIKQVNREGVIDADDITTSCIKYICHLQSKIDEESAHLKTYENELAKLENSKPIQDILDRERKESEEIEMTFAKFTFKEKITTEPKKKLFKKILELLR